MKQVCLHCSRQAPPGSLWCQEAYCASDDKPVLLEPGETLGEIEIINTAAILRTGIVYAAERQDKPILVKVAHPGLEVRLKREAFLLAKLQQRSKQDAGAHPALPLLLPAHAQAKLANYPYGKTVLKGSTFYYAVFEFISGEPLTDVLLQNPQPWYQRAGWLVLSISDAVALLHSHGYLHLCLSPEVILVRYDRDGIPRPVLLDLGAATPAEKAMRNWQPSYTSPGYLAPELLQGTSARYGAISDVYGLGLILYEMLSGGAAFPAAALPIDDVHKKVLETQPIPLERADLRNIPELAVQATSKDRRRRPQNVIAFGRELQASLPSLPREKQERRVNWRLIAVGLATAMALALLIALAVSLGAA